MGFSASIGVGDVAIAGAEATDSAGMGAGTDGAGGDSACETIGGGALAIGVEEGNASGRGAVAQPTRTASVQKTTQVLLILMNSPD